MFSHKHYLVICYSSGWIHWLWALQGAGKTSLLKAILARGRITAFSNIENLLPEADAQEGIAGGLCYCDSAGVNLQVLTHLPMEWFELLYIFSVALYTGLAISHYFSSIMAYALVHIWKFMVFFSLSMRSPRMSVLFFCLLFCDIAFFSFWGLVAYPSEFLYFGNLYCRS